jgi:hypothetical protein
MLEPFWVAPAPDVLDDASFLLGCEENRYAVFERIDVLDPFSESLGSVDKATAAEGEDIVVTGTRVFRLDFPDYPQATITSSDWSEFVSGGGGGTGEAPADSDVMDITINISRALTASETAALEALKATIAAITTAIAKLADNAIVTLPNGADVTGRELKAIWAVTDFVINDNNFTYPNGGGGEANMSYGNPTVSFNIGYLDSYDGFSGGMNYLVAHELGHLSQAGTSFYTDQLTANNIARALLNGGGLAYLANPGYGYSATAPMQFSVPTSSTGGTDPGTGYTGGTGNDPKTIEH